MTPSTEVDTILQNIEPSKFTTYHQLFMRALILEAISGHNLTFDRLSHQLYILNKEIYEDLCQTAIGYFELYAPQKYKSFGN